MERRKVEGFKKNEILTDKRNYGKGSYQKFKRYSEILNGSYPEIFSSSNYGMMMLITL